MTPSDPWTRRPRTGRPRQPSRATGDDGYMLITAVLIVLVLGLLATSLVAASHAQLWASANQQSALDALTRAQAGADSVQVQLPAIIAGFQAPAAAATATLQWPPAPDPKPQWKAVVCPADSTGACVAPAASTGNYLVKVTGSAGNGPFARTRIIAATYGQPVTLPRPITVASGLATTRPLTVTGDVWANAAIDFQGNTTITGAVTSATGNLISEKQLTVTGDIITGGAAAPTATYPSSAVADTALAFYGPTQVNGNATAAAQNCAATGISTRYKAIGSGSGGKQITGNLVIAGATAPSSVNVVGVTSTAACRPAPAPLAPVRYQWNSANYPAGEWTVQEFTGGGAVGNANAYLTANAASLGGKAIHVVVGSSTTATSTPVVIPAGATINGSFVLAVDNAPINVTSLATAGTGTVLLASGYTTPAGRSCPDACAVTLPALNLTSGPALAVLAPNGGIATSGPVTFTGAIHAASVTFGGDPTSGTDTITYSPTVAKLPGFQASTTATQLTQWRELTA